MNNTRPTIKADVLSRILHISEESLMYRVVKIRYKEESYRKRAANGEFSVTDIPNMVRNICNDELVGYNYVINGTDKRPLYTFYKINSVLDNIY